MVVFEDRLDAGRQLAARLAFLRGQDVVVLGLPRGGVPVAYVVAEALDAPLDVILVRKLGLPFQPELAMGAIGEGGIRVVDRALVGRAGITDKEVEAVERRERTVLDARVEQLRRGRPRVALRGRVTVVVDDGIATGATARVACEVAKQLGAERIVLAVPVAAAQTMRHLAEADLLVCVSAPERLRAVGAHYKDFSPTSEDEVVAILDRAGRRAHVSGTEGRAGHERDVDEQVIVPAGRVTVEGHLRVPDGAVGVVLFAHGGGSRRHSPRNRFVADVLHAAGLATLLLDLLTSEEEGDRAKVFDIPLLADRLEAATDWLALRTETAACRVGYLGASTGAGAALWAAADPGATVAAVVSRGGRPDLAGPRLAAVRAPTLLIVGGADDAVIGLNRQARAELHGCHTGLAVVPGATHLFEEPGTLAEVARLARDWFIRHLVDEAPGATRRPPTD